MIAIIIRSNYLVTSMSSCRVKRWVVNCRCKNIDMENIERLYDTRVVCSMHFEECFYYNPNDKAHSTLYSHAIPTIIDVPNPPHRATPRRPPPKRRIFEPEHDVVLPSIKKVRISKSSEVAIPHSSQHDGDGNQHLSGEHEEVKKDTGKYDCYWRRRYETLRKQYLRLFGEKTRLKRRIEKLKSSMKDSSAHKDDPNTLMVRSENLPHAVLEFVKTQLRFFSKMKRGMRWTDEEIRFAMSIHYASTAAYQLLRSTFGLPSLTVLYTNVSMCLSESGVCRRTLEGMRLKLQTTKPQEKVCSITFDGMKISKSLKHYKNDKILGYVEMGSGERNNGVASEMLLFMAHGISTSWKQILGYYFVNPSSKYYAIMDGLRQCILQLRSIGITVICIICDQEPLHQRIIRENSDNGNSFCCGDESIPIIYDIPHLLKSTRNCMLKYKIKIGGQIIADASHIEKFHIVQRKQNLRLAPKLTDIHISPNTRQRMRVKYAAQYMSHSVYSGMMTCINHGLLTRNAAVTAKFVKKIDELFDILNSLSVSARPGKEAITKDNMESKFAVLDDAMSWIESWTFDGGRSVQMPFQKGWILTISNIKRIVRDLLDCGFHFVGLRKLNQDCLENTFATVRGKGGYNSHPTLPQAKAAVRAISWNSLIQPISNATSCEKDDTSVILSEIRTQNCISDEQLNPNDSHLQEHIDLTDEFQLTPSFTRDICEKEVSSYVLGYIMRRKVTCCECRNDLMGSKKSVLTSFKEIDGCTLLTPNEALSTSLSTIQHFIFINLEQIGHLNGISQIFIDEIIQRQFLPSDMVKCKCNNNTTDIITKEIVNFFIRLYCKRTNEKFEKEKQKNIEKIKKWKR